MSARKTDKCSRCGEPMWPLGKDRPKGPRVCRPCRAIGPAPYGYRSERTSVTCPICLIGFIRGPSCPRQVYCSKSCAAIHKNAIRAASGTKRGRDKEKVRANTAAKRARRRATFVEMVYPEVVFKRDNYRCHLCGKKCNRKVNGLHPDGATMDHIIPTSLGGPHSYVNIATAHRKCNVAKGARAANDQLALIG